MSPRAFLVLFCLCALSAGTPVWAQSPAKASPSPTVAAEPSPTPTPGTRAVIDSMDAADLKEAIQLLKSNYIKPEALNETELSRATFEGILARLGRGVVLLQSPAADATDSAAPLFGEVLEG